MSSGSDSKSLESVVTCADARGIVWTMNLRLFSMAGLFADRSEVDCFNPVEEL